MNIEEFTAIERVRLRRYDIPLLRPLTLASRTVARRKGVIISLTDDEGHTAHGEAAPLPGLHKETLRHVTSELDYIRRMGKRCTTWHITEAAEEMSSSARTALEMAMFDLLAQRRTSQVRQGVTIPVSALVMADADDVYDEVESLLAAGYRSIKVKVARRPLVDDITTMQRLREQIAARAEIRLDANRLWSLDDAVTFCNEVGREGIAYIEEPLADTTQYPAFHDRTDMPVALDETLVELGIERAAQWQGASAFVLKPSLLGGLAWTGEFIASALQKGITPVISSAFESDLSLRAYALFADLLGRVDTPLGLDTLKWFREPLLARGWQVSEGHVDIDALRAVQPKLRDRLLQKV
ncbi:MAG: o-succinylbenzoate synthase [Phycisphaerae bacterium]|nr:o-succinylbenzoate synthase [Phycisphaerae bacterium]